MEEIVNKVSQSGIVTINLEEMYPAGERIEFDIAPQLIEGLLLREKDFREFIKSHPWENYKGKYVALFCSTDAIIPHWAWMLLANALSPFAEMIVFGKRQELETEIFSRLIERMDVSPYKDQRVVIKGCADLPVPVNAYVRLTSKLTPVVKSLMYGEPCSTVPLYKRK